MAGKAQHAAHWAQQLLECLQRLAAQQSNAVLQTLAGVDVIQNGRRYPDRDLVFGHDRWRAFYHCHEAEGRSGKEHGHFHIFTDVGDDTWAHVAGLAMDDHGQPLHWFAVNRWVTDGPWFDHARLLPQLQSAEPGPQDGLTARWLCAILQLCRNELGELLRARDARIRGDANPHDRTAAMDDRHVYLLATREIQLQTLLEQHLLH